MVQYDSEVFSKNLTSIMKQRCISQSEIIKELSFSKSAVSAWVNGTRVPKAGTMKMLAEYIGVSVNELTRPTLEMSTEMTGTIKTQVVELITDNYFSDEETYALYHIVNQMSKGGYCVKGNGQMGRLVIRILNLGFTSVDIPEEVRDIIFSEYGSSRLCKTCGPNMFQLYVEGGKNTCEAVQTLRNWVININGCDEDVFPEKYISIHAELNIARFMITDPVAFALENAGIV